MGWFSADPAPALLALELPKALADAVDPLLRDGEYYRAIKEVRRRTGADLVLGKRAVDERARQLGLG